MKLILVLLAFNFAVIFPAMAEDAVIGTAQDVEGQVSIIHAQQQDRAPLVSGDAIHQDDKIETATASRLSIKFIDDTEIELGSNGSLTIDDYIYDPKNPSAAKAHYSILHTAFSYISGKISHGGGDASIGVDFGSIGIRGTKILRGMRDGECWIYLQDGAITVSNEGGTIDLAAGQMTRMHAKSSAPAKAATWSEGDENWIKDEIAAKD